MVRNKVGGPTALGALELTHLGRPLRQYSQLIQSTSMGSNATMTLKALPLRGGTEPEAPQIIIKQFKMELSEAIKPVVRKLKILLKD